MQFGAVFSSILGTELFVAGGWVSVSFGTASFNILPLLVLPLLMKVKESRRIKVDSTDKEYTKSTDRSNKYIYNISHHSISGDRQLNPIEPSIVPTQLTGTQLA